MKSETQSSSLPAAHTCACVCKGYLYPQHLTVVLTSSHLLQQWKGPFPGTQFIPADSPKTHHCGSHQQDAVWGLPASPPCFLGLEGCPPLSMLRGVSYSQGKIWGLILHCAARGTDAHENVHRTDATSLQPLQIPPGADGVALFPPEHTFISSSALEELYWVKSSCPLPWCKSRIAP